jgi:penicillin-binding protein 2
VLILAACAADPATQPFGGAPVATITAPVSLAPAADVAVRFVDALNAGDYVSAHGLLDEGARTEAATPELLKAVYDSARAASRTMTITARLRGGLIADGIDKAEAQLVSTWESPLLGAFEVTTTLPLRKSDAWRINWTRNAIAPGLANGQLVIQQKRLPRASIFASDGTLLAGPSERITLGVQRNLLRDTDEETRMLAALSQVTGLTPDAIRAKYIDTPLNWYVPIVDLEVDQVENNSALLQPFSAVIAQSSYVRVIYRPDIAPHVLGFTGAITPETLKRYQALGYAGDERVGISGVEAGAEAVLIGRPEFALRVLGDGRVRTIVEREAVRGDDVTVTISPTLQLTAQQLLEQRRGAAVVLRVNDGAVLSMASYPTYDPTNIGNEDVRAGALLNRATQGLYPPGSVFKMVTMAAGLGEGVAENNTVYFDPGFWVGYGKDFRKNCWRSGGHGRITLKDGLTASCNIVFYEVGKQLEERSSFVLGDYARKFGFGAPTGIELAAEQGGVAPDPDYKKQAFGEDWRPGDTVNMAVGQGYMLVTPLQIARMTLAIANGGSLHVPYVIAAPPQPKPAPAQLPITPGNLSVMQNAMLGVTTNARIGTTTYRFTTFDYYEVDGRWVAGKELPTAQRRTARRLNVAGKSGTAQAPGDALPFAWFTAYAPADAPEIAVTVLLENAGQGSAQAGPVVRQLIEAYFGLPLSATPKDALAND